MNEFDVDKQIEAALLIQAQTVIEFYNKDNFDRLAMVQWALNVIERNTPPVQPKDYEGEG